MHIPSNAHSSGGKRRTAILVKNAPKVPALVPPCPIHRLPPEILMQIFSYGVHLTFCNFTEYFPTQAVASTCRSWRQLALSNSSLWSTINVTMSVSSTHDLKRLDKFVSQTLKRSEMAKLSWSLLLDSYHDGYGSEEDENNDLIDEEKARVSKCIWSIFQKLFLQQDRWVKMDLTCSSKLTGLYSYGTLALHVGRLGTLQTLSLDIPSCTIDVSNDPIAELNALPSLRVLNFRLYNDERADKLVMAGSNLLKVQIMDPLYIDGYQPVHRRDPSPIVARHNLQLLELDARPASSECTQYLLSTLSCPSLQRVFFRDFGDHTLSIASNFMLRSSPPLSNIFISIEDGVRISRGNFVAFIRSIPTVRSLRIRSNANTIDSTEFLSSLSRTKSGSHGPVITAFELVPHLERFALLYMSVAGHAILEFATARWNASNRCIREIQIIKCKRDEEGQHTRDLPIPRFHGTDPTILPEYWGGMNHLILNGLEFSCT